MWLVQGRTCEGLAWPEAGEGGLVFQALKGEGLGRITPVASPERGLIHAVAGAGSDVDGRRALKLPESAREGEYFIGWMSERSEDCNTHKKEVQCKIQDYFVIPSEKLNTWMNIYHIIIDNNTYCIF